MRVKIDKSALFLVAVFGVTVLIIVAAVFWMMFQWALCRSEGFGVWYCVQHSI